MSEAQRSTFEQHEQPINALAARDRAPCPRVYSEHRRDTQAAALTMLGRCERGGPSGAVG